MPAGRLLGIAGSGGGIAMLVIGLLRVATVSAMSAVATMAEHVE